MSYYRGDGRGNYYGRGDYYRGDPFLGGLIMAGVKKFGGKALGWAGRQLGGSAGRAAAAVARDAVPTAIAGLAGYQAGRAAGPSMQPFAGPTMSTPYADERYGSGGRRRRINPLNPKALRRALRRAEGFEKFAARTVNSLYRVIDGRRVRTFKKRTRSS